MLTNSTKKYTYLALGDSYTIGEQVLPSENFPGQVVKMMLNDSIEIEVRIIAKTGWTTDELETGIKEAHAAEPLLKSYDIVSLLIGVNDQYRRRSVENYIQAFEQLLMKAIHFAGNRLERVVVLSIPDWGITPFAEGRDRAEISKQIDTYNEVNKQLCQYHGIHYINITPWTREAATDLSLLTTDGLHPSGKEYGRWAMEIAAWIKKMV